MDHLCSTVKPYLIKKKCKKECYRMSLVVVVTSPLRVKSLGSWFCILYSMTENMISLLLHRNTFSGKMSAYGAGNDDTLNTVKAGPGTIFLKEGNQLLLTVSGDTDSSVQNQTYAYITGEANEYTYDQLTLDGNSNAKIIIIFFFLEN